MAGPGLSLLSGAAIVNSRHLLGAFSARTKLYGFALAEISIAPTPLLFVGYRRAGRFYGKLSRYLPMEMTMHERLHHRRAAALSGGIRIRFRFMMRIA